TSVDPIRYELIFERFMDEVRKEPPDIDIDFCQERREKVLDYVRDRYGRENVAQIITFGTMAARGVIRDVARVLRFPLDQTDRLAKMVPTALNVTLNSALQDSPDLAAAYKNDPQVRRIIDIGKRLEGLARHASTHAAGVVLADKPLSEYVPLAKMGDEITTQYEMESLEKVGLVKIDFLGLKTLTVLDRALGMIRARHDVEIDLDDLDLSDAKTFEMLGRGESMGVFQFESSGFRDLLKRMKPDRFADLIACVALYRPGPLGGGMVDDYVKRKHGLEPVNYPHEKLEHVLAPTYGVMVYQEQVMRIVNLLGGISMSESYTLVKAISKKRVEYIEAMRERFIEGAVANGFDRRRAEGLFDQIQYFGGYGFNQSHSTAYALIAFQTAFLKAHYPTEFMAALMTYEMTDTDKLAVYVDECRRTMKIRILPPDINESEAGFTVTDSGIRFGLAAVKGVGTRGVEGIVEARRGEDGPFKSLFDFCSRVDLRVANKAVVEALIKCGAFDRLGGRRTQYLAVLDRALRAGQRMQADRGSGQTTFFDQFASASSEAPGVENLPDLPEWTEQQLLAVEKETLGFYLTTHPLIKHREELETHANTPIDRLKEFDDGTELTLGVMLSQVRHTVTQKGKSRGERMAMMNLEDLSGKCDAVAFPRAFVSNETLIHDEAVVFVRGKLNLRREPPSIEIEQIVPLDEAPLRLTESVVLTVDERHQDKEAMQELRGLLARHPGNCSVFLKLVAPDGLVTTVRADSSFSVTPDASFRDDVAAFLGEGHLSFIAVGPRLKVQSVRNGGGSWRRN
ncbi:MAG TPA: DNA polymerase III subunit alpha, partial [Planctomycetota bacterium]|nr:DNA polymerase III subunit alpha [Planctomycetota bacterium]